MAADVVITDGSNSITLNVETWSYDIQRQPHEFTLKTLPALGVKDSITTDFGAYQELYILTGWVGTRTLANNLLTYSYTTWYESGNDLTLTIPALSADDDAVSVIPDATTAPIVTNCWVWQDANQDGVTIYRFELTMAVAKKL